MPRDKKRARTQSAQQPHVSIPQMFMPQMMPMQSQSHLPMQVTQTLPPDPQDDNDSSSSDESLETAAARRKQEQQDQKQLTSSSTYFCELPKKRLQRFAQAVDGELFDLVSTCDLDKPELCRLVW